MKKIFALSLLFVVFAAMPCFAADMGQIAIFNEAVGWTTVQHATQQTQIILDRIKITKNIEVLNDKDIGTFAENGTGDGDLDVIITFGYFPVSLYAPGNGEPDDSVAELFLEDGNMFINTADYIFYVTQGGGTNGDAALKNITDSTFDLWTDNTAIEPTEDGEKYTPSLKAFTSHRAFQKGQVEADDEWELEVEFGTNGLNSDPSVIRNTEYDGRVCVVHQVSNDAMPRGDVIVEILNNWLATVVRPQPVEPADKLPLTWGEIKADF
ncbi:hypothetical protein GF312_13905 [Candidatus Poribacteria bacterium]|nr:hypothetical protein [Candidatus Poribacteria bacterium]